jgi:formylglycine-generating enzyme required for sulfatase activity
MYKNFKAISPVVATALLLVVAVVAVVGFQGWFDTFQSSLFGDVELDSNSAADSTLSIEGVIGNTLYVKNNIADNLSIVSLKIDDDLCNLSGQDNLSLNVDELDISSCLDNLSSSSVDVVLITSNQVVEKKVFLKNVNIVESGSGGGSESFSSCTLDGQSVSHGANYTFYKYDKPYNSDSGCTGISQERTCTDGTLDGSSDYDTASCNDAIAPSQGGEWVLVFGNSGLGTSDFYVMKYEAKDVSGTPTSQPSQTPWVSINQTDANLECESLGEGYHLITDPQWVTMARDAENNPNNWNTSEVGNGYMFTGHNDGNPSNILSVINTGDYYDQTGDSDTGTCDGASKTWDSENPWGCEGQKRVLELASGEIIWDVAGNVWEWTNDTIEEPDSALGLEGTDGWGWHEWDEISGTGYEYLGPSVQTYNYINGVGRVYADNNGATDGGTMHAFLRGGDNDRGSDAGTFALFLAYAPSGMYTGSGFRCSYAP